MSRAAWLAPLLAIACSGAPTPRHYHLDIAQAFTVAQANAILDAATEWQTSSGGFVSFDGQASTTDVIHVHPSTAADIAAEFGGGAWGFDRNGSDSATIAMLSTLDAESFHQTALHELGHALGLVHMPPGNVMCASSTCATLVVTCGDLDQLMGSRPPGCFP